MQSVIRQRIDAVKHKSMTELKEQFCDLFGFEIRYGCHLCSLLFRFMVFPFQNRALRMASAHSSGDSLPVSTRKLY